ncbi:helix-turn-helix transcriptional regulator [Actinosynnema sp. NPDC023587]|uniref:helix-turn-helix domain-containing protein n=1 Tax=Actinosynnema sp. NPDC023587 TaxID=3154695 RepID=UPI003404DC44
MDIDDAQIGRRVREVRSWRQMNLSVAAGLAGISPGYLSMIERGLRPVTKRSLLEALAQALRVSPTDLTGAPYRPDDPVGNAAHSALDDIETALAEWLPGEVPDSGPARPWTQVESDMDRLTALRRRSDYAGQGEILPPLIRDLLIHAHGEHRQSALSGLIEAYLAAGNVSARLGRNALAFVAGERALVSAELDGQPEWRAAAAWIRAHLLSAVSRPRQYSLSIAVAEFPGARLETRGMGHLTAALAAASQSDADTARAHLDAAAEIATRPGIDPDWGRGLHNFSSANVGTWRVAIGTELGDGGKVGEIARTVEWQVMPVSRQGAFWMDLGRGLLQDKKTRERGLKAILQAEALTPQQVRINPFAREAVSDLLRRAKREAGGADLRALAWRMGIAPNG